MSSGRVHPTALVHADAVLGDDVEIGPFTVVGPTVSIGRSTRIGAHCLLGEGPPAPLQVGPSSLIRSHTVLYSGSDFGEGLETGHHVVLRAGLRVGRNARIGTFSDLQGSTLIGDYVRLHSNVFVAQGSILGSFVWLFPHVVLTNDPHPPSDECTSGPTVERYAVVGARATLLPAVRIGANAVVAAGATVTRDVAPGRLVAGTPARDVKAAGEVVCADGRLDRPYPWWTHFRRGYPAEVDFTGSGPRGPGEGPEARSPAVEAIDG